MATDPNGTHTTRESPPNQSAGVGITGAVERTRAIFETAMVADGNETEQLRGAVHYYNNRNDQSEKIASAAVAKAANDQMGVSWLYEKVVGTFGGELPENFGELNDEIQKRATYLVQAYRMPAKVALEKAAQSVAKHYVTVNGWGVSTNDQRLPPNFKRITETYIRDFVFQIGAEEAGPNASKTQKQEAGYAKLGVEDHRDITVIPMRGGVFQLFNKRTGQPIFEPLPIDWKGRKQDGRFITPDTLADLADWDRDKEEARAERVGQEARRGSQIGLDDPSGVNEHRIGGREAAERERQALQPMLKAIAPRRKIGEPFVQLRPTRTPPAPWLDLSAGRAE